MDTQKNLATLLAIQAGILICFALIAYFLLMKYLGFADVSELRYFNILIQFFGLLLTIRFYKNRNDHHIKYLEGYTLGFFTSAISVSLFAIFIFLYFLKADPALLDEIKKDAPMGGRFLTPFSAAISVLSEGMVAGLVTSFALMQYYKDDTLHSPYKKRGPKSSTE